MTTLRTIASTETDPQAPITSALMKALQLNLLAALEGDPTAVAAGVSLRLAALQQIAAGDTIKLRYDTTLPTSSTAFVRPVTVGIVQTGTVRITFEHRVGTTGTGEARAVLIRAGVTTVIVATYSTTSTSFTARSVDVSVIPGDRIGFDHRHTTGSATSEIRNLRISTDASGIIFPMDNFGQWENLS